MLCISAKILMQRLCFLAFLSLTTAPLFAAEGVPADEAAASTAVSPKAYVLFEFLGFPLTNSMLMGWTLSLVIILGFRAMAGWGRPGLIPTKGQLVAETILEGVRGLIEPIVGKHMVRPTLPLLLGFFTFILIHNWSGLLPGVGNFGLINEHGHLIYFMRPANADLNMTLALALVHFAAWIYFIMKYAGPRLVLHDIFGNKAEKKEVPGPIYAFLFFIFFFVGLIELISIAFRNVSLPFRLFGNVFGGENLLTAMIAKGMELPVIGYIIPVPFYFLELLIGFVQALVFTLLVAVYIGLICNHDSGEHEAHAKPAH
jgi:F-type H+-transporting ATPase subunit a